MTRYFYTNPLAAAWMAKHFGMEFQSAARDTDEPYWDIRFVGGQPYRLTPHRRGGIEVQEDGPLFIHPNTLHLLTPDVSDLIVGNWSSHFVESRSDRKQASDLIATAGFRIIQRDGKPFHWPESELAAPKENEA